MQFSTWKTVPFEALALAYGKGVLTPFIGAGLSFPSSPLWLGFIEHLELAAGLQGAPGKDSGDLIRRASRAALTLRHRSPTALSETVREAMYRNARAPSGGIITPEATEALARIWWPLVLTTNYESLFLDAWNREWVHEKTPRPDPLPRFASMLPMGRGRVDCQRVLNSTRGPDNPLLWALQGFICDKDDLHPLAEQLTIGHEEYRRQTHEAVHFRRAFAEIYRSRTLLFLGSGLSESYLIDLFGEVLELLGTIGHFHYALVPEGEVDTDFLRKRLQILAIEYPRKDIGHATADFLGRLKDAIDGSRARTSQWAMKLDVASQSRAEDAVADVVVVRGGLHKSGDETVATAVGAGKNVSDGRPKIGKDSMRLIQCFGLDPDPATLPLERVGETHVYRIVGYPLFVVVARDFGEGGSRARDSREVAPAVAELMDTACNDGFARVDVMLLAAGRGRTFPAHISLHEMVRGYCEWHARTPAKRRIPLWIRTKDPRLLALLESGRLDLASMTDSARLRFWVEIEMDGDSPAPILAIAEASSSIAELARDYEIPDTGWEVSARPAPTKDHRPSLVNEVAQYRLREFGVLAGSTVIFSRSS